MVKDFLTNRSQLVKSMVHHQAGECHKWVPQGSVLGPILFLIYIRQFQSAFTRESDAEILFKGTSPFTPMGEITVDPNGVLKLLNNLKIHKASGSDGLSARVLKECSSEIAPILALIYNESLALGTVPDEWPTSECSPDFQERGEI